MLFFCQYFFCFIPLSSPSHGEITKESEMGAEAGTEAEVVYRMKLRHDYHLQTHLLICTNALRRKVVVTCFHFRSKK